MSLKDKDARRAYNRAYRVRHRDYLLAYDRERANTPSRKASRQNTHTKYRARKLVRFREYYQKNKARFQAYSKQWHADHPEWRNQYNRAYFLANAERIREQARLYATKHKARRRQVQAAWREINREAHRRYSREYVQKRLVVDVNFAMRNRLRCRLYMLLRRKGIPKYGTALSLVGCTVDQLRAHLESQFLPGMRWDNRRLWEIDHIRPCASFDLADPEQQKACFHFTNLQPLWGLDNLRKGKQFHSSFGARP